MDASLIEPPYPMLASAGTLDHLARANERGYVIEEKYDGIRCLAIVGDVGGVQLYNRQRRNITKAFPDVALGLRTHCLPGTQMLGPLVLDGEIVVDGADGWPDFQLVQHRANRVRDIEKAVTDYPARYIAFDVLSSGNVDYTSQAFAVRRSILQEIVPLHYLAQAYHQHEVQRLLDGGLGEGVVLKHLAGTYTPGMRSSSWIKVKFANEADVFVGGVTHGYGKRLVTFGGLLVGLPMPADKHGLAKLTYVGTVGTGFTDDALDELRYDLARLRTGVNPFAEHDPGWDLEFFVVPMIGVRVRFANWTRDRIMRHPRYLGRSE